MSLITNPELVDITFKLQPPNNMRATVSLIDLKMLFFLSVLTVQGGPKVGLFLLSKAKGAHSNFVWTNCAC